MRFDYKKYEVQPFPGQTIPGIMFRPVIRIRILGTRTRIAFRGLADTGADMTVLPKTIADLVGCVMLPSTPRYALGAVGTLDLYYGKVLFEVGSGQSPHRWCATVGITKESWTEAILGHVGFLQFFDATFLGKNQILQLKRNKLPFESIDLQSPD